MVGYEHEGLADDAFDCIITDASVVSINSLSKSGYYKIGFSQSKIFNISKATCISCVHLKIISFFNRFDKGLASFENFEINRR